METTLRYKLPVFEGPLDLLLTLISKNKIDIYDIQISDLLDQYMEQINMMQENQMDIASEFLTMASRLVYIKSVMLLPKYEEEAEELKKELSGQLLEYAVCREIAAKLGIDITTVKTHIRNMLQKTGFANRTTLAINARTAGIAVQLQ